MSDVNTLVKDSIDEIDLNKIIKESVKMKMEETIKSIINDQMRSYSDFGKNIEQTIKNALSFDPSSKKLEQYGDFVMEQVNNSLGKYMSTLGKEQIQKHLSTAIIGEHRDEIEFKDFVKELDTMLESLYEFDACSCDGEEPFRMEINNKDYSWSKDWYELRIYRPGDSGSYSYSKKEDKVLLSCSINKGIFSVNCEESDFSEIAGWLKALKFRKTKISDAENEEYSYGPEY